MYSRKDFFLLGAVLISFVVSVYLWFTGHREAGQFVGIWVPSILGLGIYLEVRAMHRR